MAYSQYSLQILETNAYNILKIIKKKFLRIIKY